MVRKDVGREPRGESSAAVLVEQVKSEFKVVLDGYQGIRERLDQVEVNTAKRHEELHKFMIDGVKTVLGEMDQRFTQVDQRFAGIDARFVEVNARLDVLTSRFDAHAQAHAG